MHFQTGIFYDLPPPALAPNVLNKEFTTAQRNEKWVANMPYILSAEGWPYLAVVLDLFSRKAVG